MDEQLENEKRLQAIDRRIQELRRRHGLLPGNTEGGEGKGGRGTEGGGEREG